MVPEKRPRGSTLERRVVAHNVTSKFCFNAVMWAALFNAEDAFELKVPPPSSSERASLEDATTQCCTGESASEGEAQLPDEVVVQDADYTPILRLCGRATTSCSRRHARHEQQTFCSFPHASEHDRRRRRRHHRVAAVTSSDLSDDEQLLQKYDAASSSCTHDASNQSQMARENSSCFSPQTYHILRSALGTPNLSAGCLFRGETIVLLWRSSFRRRRDAQFG